MTTARALAALALLAALAARAQEDQLAYGLPVDLAVTTGALAVWSGTALAKASLAPTACRVCAVPALDAWARHGLRWDDPAPARRSFDVLGYAILPASGVALTLVGARGRGESWSQGFTDLLLVTEAVSISGSVSQLVKLAVGRQRPSVHYANSAEADRRPESDDNLSFYSGHTALAFSLVAATSTVASLRGARAAHGCWGSGWRPRPPWAGWPSPPTGTTSRTRWPARCSARPSAGACPGCCTAPRAPPEPRPVAAR